MPRDELPLIDVSGLVAGETDQQACAQLDDACREHGFFAITGHGIPPSLREDLQRLSHEFFALSGCEKDAIAMRHAGSAWRGWFPLGGELTSGRPDGKEGLYFGTEHSQAHPRVVEGTALDGPNQFPDEPSMLGPTVLAWLESLTSLGHVVMRGISVGLGLPPRWFGDHLMADPTILFRVFHYPPDPSFEWGVAEHTDYGLLTLLAQDNVGGLQVHSNDRWIEVPADPDVFVCNIGDMLDRLTNGRYRSTPHRVQNTSGQSRLSFPLFFDPSWDATVETLPLANSTPAEVTANAGTMPILMPGMAPMARTSPPRWKRFFPSFSQR